ncbi:hypothetical protein BDV29DRAFT_143599 [Aspergillus leporis]|uniref:Uncharacterized protein n=1 Tax=Aspergillus leporis TaxID=41062 RepID=A0A5N5X0N2_9EURO|nr:hypothetical protein BDV29DRAFT_143599 [Aspergillus leporis]
MPRHCSHTLLTVPSFGSTCQSLPRNFKNREPLSYKIPTRFLNKSPPCSFVNQYERSRPSQRRSLGPNAPQLTLHNHGELMSVLRDAACYSFPLDRYSRFSFPDLHNN